MHIYSFDCALINMGVSHIWYDKNIIIPTTLWDEYKIIDQYQLEDQVAILEDMMNVLRVGLDNCFKVIKCERWDLGSNNRDPWQWAIPLAQKLSGWITHPPGIMIYEFQMNANNISRSIGNMIVYHFMANHPSTRVVRIQPSLKNQLCIGGHLLTNYLKQYTSTYKANKVHSTQIMRWVFQRFGWTLPTGKLDDIADSITQTLAYIKHT